MDKNSIIKSVKRQEEEKVAVSLKLPASLKDQLQAIAEKESISMNSLIVAVIQSFLDDDCGIKIKQMEDNFKAKGALVQNWLESYLNQLDVQLGYPVTDPDDFANHEFVKIEIHNINTYLKEIKE